MANNKEKEQYSNLCTPFSLIYFKMSFDNLYKHYFDQLLYIAMRLVIIKGLPATVNETYLKYCVLCLGKVVFFRLDQEIPEDRQSADQPLKPGDVVALNGSDSNATTVYKMHRECIVNNSAFLKSYLLTPGKDCEIVYCTEPDKYKVFGYGGLFSLIARTATILADNDISINCAQKNTRLVNVLSADDTATARSVQKAVDQMYSGDPYLIAQSNLVGNLQGVPMTQRTATNDIVQLIEMRQYIYSHFYEALGLQTHDNMKKERLITDEINDNEEISALNIDDIIETLREGFDRVNRMFGTEITVELNPIVQRAHEDEQLMDEDPDELPAMDPEPEPDPLPEDEPEEEDIFKYYDSVELRRIIAGLKKVIDEDEEAAEDQTEDAAEDAAEDQTEDAAEDQTEDAAEDQTEDAAEDQTEDAAEDAAEDQTEDAAEDQTEDAEPAISIEVSAEDNAEVSIDIHEEVIEDAGRPETVEGDLSNV